MSWPTWSTTPAPIPSAMAAPVQSTLLPTAINSAPAVMPPGLQYSPEQWAQAQQQNWQQWAQWQQQYQQWHQQYGAEYQKSMSAMQSNLAAQQPPLPAMPNTGVPPPLPAEHKPPLPPEDPPANQPSMIPSYSTMPPKPVQGGYSTAPPPLITQQMQPPPQVADQYGHRQNWQPNQQNPNKRPFSQGPDYENIKRPLMDRPNQWGNNNKSNPVQSQWSSRPSQNVSYHTQPPPQSQPSSKPNIEELSEAEKKFDKEFAAWEAQFNKWKEQNASHPDKTQYREYEKKWESWRNSLLERREQMRRKRLAMNTVGTKPFGFNQPSVPQSITIDQVQAPTTVPPTQLSLADPLTTQPIITDNLISNPPPQQNNEPLSFKSPNYRTEEVTVAPSDGFLKSSFSGGIPGLDLVKEDETINTQRDDVIDLVKEEKKEEKLQETAGTKGPDFDAISKGINSILGDQKLLSMLSMVSQNPPATPAPNVTDSVSNIANGGCQIEHNFSAPPPPHKFNEAPPHGNFTAPPPTHQYNEAPPQGTLPPCNDQSNQSYEDKSNQGENCQQRESVNNFDDQTRSSFTMGLNDQDAGFSGNNFYRNQGNKFMNNKFGVTLENDRIINRNTFAPDGKRQGDTNFGNNVLDGGRNKLSSNRGDFGQGSFPKDSVNFKHADNFKRADFNKGSNFNRNDNFNRDANLANANRVDAFPVDKFSQENKFNYNDNFNRYNHNFRRDQHGSGNNSFEDRRAGNFGETSHFNRSNNITGRESFNNNFNQRGNYNETNDYEEYENYNEDEDYDKYHDMFNDEDQNFSPHQNQLPQGQVRGTQVMETPPPKTPEPSVVEEAIFEPATVVDYEHKSLRPTEPDVVVEPIHMFDYRHKPLNRIPLPQRPIWLSESVKFIREFDPLASRSALAYERSPLDRYPSNPREVRREEWRPDITEDRYGPCTRSYDDRGRRYTNEFDSHDRIERRPFNTDEFRFERETKDDDRNRRKFIEPERYNRKKNNAETSRMEAKHNTRGNNDFEEFSDDDMDFESDEQKKHKQTRDERSASKSPILSNPPNPANFSDVTMIEDIINPPGRFNRPPRIVIILRGPPGSGKTFLAKLIKDKEVENGGSAPRILSLDDYFMVEHEKEILEDGKLIKVKEMVYEYEAEMEESYRISFVKAFKKTITDGYFPFIIVDNINDKVKYFGEMWSFAKQNGFQVYICQMDLDPSVCTKRNVHNRCEAEIEQCIAGWEPTPTHHPTIDASGLLESSAISDVEMEEVEQQPQETNSEEVPEDEVRSKWDTFDCSSNNLAKLDGVSKPLRPSRTMEEYLQLEDDWEPTKSTKPGQKRVRWADLEEQREQKKMRAIGFIVGHTDWERMMDPTEGSNALTKTKYIDRIKNY